jgi:predicted ATPase
MSGTSLRAVITAMRHTPAKHVVAPADRDARPLQMARGLWNYWLERGQLDEGERWIRQALERSDPDAELRAWMVGV